MKQPERTASRPAARPARGLGRIAATGLAVAIGAGVLVWMNRIPTAGGPAATSAPPIAAPVTSAVSLPTAAAPAPAAARAELPPTPPPGIVLVGTVPDAQPPQATLLVDGRLQSQPLGSSVAGVGLQVREVTPEGIALGQPDGPPLYTLRITSAAEATRLLAEARAQRLAERQPTLVRPAGDPVLQRDADRAAALPDEMKVTVHRRQPVTAGPVGSL